MSTSPTLSAAPSSASATTATASTWSTQVTVAIDEQSPDIAQGVDHAFEERAGDTDLLDTQGAGDQGMMVGYACNETRELMPVPIALAHRLSRRLAQVRRSGEIPYLRPDGKTQVTVEYEGRKPVRLDTVVVSSQHGLDVDIETLLAPDIREHVIDAVLPRTSPSEGMRVFVNPTGRFELGGPHVDTGLTGRKIVVDTYGGMACHGGGAFPARTRPRSTARPPTRSAGWPRTWSRPAWPSAARSRSPTHRRRPPGQRVRRDLRHRAGRP